MPKLSPEQVLYMINNKGMKQAEIAELFGTSRQRVHQLAVEAGYVPVTTTISENMPWEVEAEYRRNHFYHNVRLHARFMLSNMAVDEVAEGSKAPLRSLYSYVYDHNMTLDYNPNHPPIFGVTKHKGFAFLPRRPEDENFIIHMREGVNITEIGNKIWRLPETKPSL